MALDTDADRKRRLDIADLGILDKSIRQFFAKAIQALAAVICQFMELFYKEFNVYSYKGGSLSGPAFYISH